MSQEIGQSEETERKTLPIERGFPIEKVNEIAAKEGRAKQWYRPIYTMHKWWARRLGCVFRAISLYTLLDDPGNVDVYYPGENGSISDYTTDDLGIQSLIDDVDLTDPNSLWDLYSKDVRVQDKKVLDPFMGGGTSIGEASRFGAETVGNDLNPVAWFITKKQMEASNVGLERLEDAYETLKENVAEDLLHYYRTECPNGDHDADIMYVLWVKEIDCVSCGHSVPLFRDYRVGKGRYDHDDKYTILDPTDWSVIRVDDWQSEQTSPATGETFDPSEGNVGRGDYSCPECGQQYGIADAVQEQDGFDLRPYAIEYHCAHCDANGYSKGEVKDYKAPSEDDIELFEQASKEWDDSPDLQEYVPDVDIPLGIMTDSSAFEGGIGGGHNLLDHGFSQWSDLFNDRQLLTLSKLLKGIDQIDDKEAREYLLLTFSNILRTNTLMIGYDYGYNKIINLFKSNSFDVPHEPAEGNPWGAEYGRGTFKSIWEMVKRGVKYAEAPTERYIEDGETVETAEFAQPIGGDFALHCSDARTLEMEDEFDVVLTDPPYYDNIIYSEISDFFYVWQRILLADEYDQFQPTETPRAESIVANPAQNKGAEEFESELGEAFGNIHRLLNKDGAVVFTYHHAGVESWGELLQALCQQEFEVTATYPINADENKFIGGEAVTFDIVIVARPATEREPISWNSLRRNIYRTAQTTRQRLEENRDLSGGDIGVVEMGRCFHEYSKHHGEVRRAGEIMTAKEVVDEIYGVIQHGSDIGEIDVFLDLLETPDASYDDLNKLCRGTDATPERMADMKLYHMEGEFTLGTWEEESRIAYIQDRVANDEELTDLDRAQFLRYRWEHGKSITEYLEQWEITDSLRELCEGLADATGDETYRNVLESRLGDF
jgi:adenine-specific DNA methylase